MTRGACEAILSTEPFQGILILFGCPFFWLPLRRRHIPDGRIRIDSGIGHADLGQERTDRASCRTAKCRAGVLTGSLHSFFTKLFNRPVNTRRERASSRSVTFGPRAGRELSGACERLLVSNLRKSFHFILLQLLPRRENTRAKERGVRGASRSGSMNKLSELTQPRVNGKRREENLSAFGVFRYFCRDF
jgi:hypothetical protein